MPNSFYGLPLHPLIVHATVVIVPLAALTVLVSVLSSRFRAWAGPLPLGLSLVGLILVPLSTSTGETLERHVKETALLEKHTEMAEGLLPWMIALVLVSGAAFFAHRGQPDLGKAVRVGLAALTIVSVVGTTVQVARIGHSGAESAWQDTDMNSQTRP